MRNSQYNSRLLELIEISRLSNEGERNRTKKLLKALFYDEDYELLNDVEEHLFLKARKQLIEQDPFFPYPKSEEVKGDLKLGHVIATMDSFGLEINQLQRNILISGAHGTGKTNLINVLIGNLVRKGIPFLKIETAKQRDRNLIKRFPKIKVIRSGNFYFNPLKGPLNTRPITWLGDFVDAYCHEMDLMQRSKSYVVNALDKAYRIFGVYEGSGNYPTLEDLMLIMSEELWRPGSRQDDFLLRNIQRIQKLLVLTENMMRCSSGYQIEKPLDDQVIIELGDRSEDVKNFVSIMLFTYILRHMISEGVSGGLKHVMIFDEAKRIFDVNLEKNFQMGIPPIDFLVSYAREYGEGLILADQEPSKLTNSIKANSNCKISYMVSGHETGEVSRMFGLDDKQKEVFMQLTTGIALVKMDEKFTAPFLVQIDHLPIEDEVSEVEVIEHSRPFINNLKSDVRPRSTILIKKVEKKKKSLSRDAEMFLISIAKDPFLSITERRDKLGMTNYKLQKVLRELVVKGYVKK